MHKLGLRLQKQVLRFAQDDKVGLCGSRTLPLAVVEQVDGFHYRVTYYFEAFGA